MKINYLIIILIEEWNKIAVCTISSYTEDMLTNVLEDKEVISIGQKITCIKFACNTVTNDNKAL